MFYEEKLIGGVLMWRSQPGGEWTPMSSEKLTQKLVAAMAEQQATQETIDAVRAQVAGYYAALDRREHGGVAQSRAMHGIEAALGMNWVQGATLAG